VREPWCPGAPRRSPAGTDEEILQQVERHAREDHGLPEIPEALVAQVLAAIR
jgi:predicted small metal-binding protein